MKNMPSSMSLARHYYETRREVLAAGGTEVAPWYRLTADERAVAVAEAAIIREAIRRVHEEHAVLLEGIAARLAAASRPVVVQV